ncbi:MAG: hypothetical protein Q7R45_08430 [Sulfuricaulis sp.]|nr:hypothetical protein [Sulfuricaulis sp.]
MFAAGTGLQAYGQLRAGQEGARAAAFEKQQYEIAAQQTRTAADQAEAKRREDLASNIGTIETIRGARGVGLGSPTGLAAISHYTDLVTRDIATERTSYLTKADNYGMAASMAGDKAEYSLLGGYMGAGTTLFTAPFRYKAAMKGV